MLSASMNIRRKNMEKYIYFLSVHRETHRERERMQGKKVHLFLSKQERSQHFCINPRVDVGTAIVKAFCLTLCVVAW